MRTADDARNNPKPGDVLRGKNAGDGSACRRTVVGANDAVVWFKQHGWGSHPIVSARRVWRDWVRNAEVLTVAQ